MRETHPLCMQPLKLVRKASLGTIHLADDALEVVSHAWRELIVQSIMHALGIAGAHADVSKLGSPHGGVIRLGYPTMKALV